VYTELVEKQGKSEYSIPLLRLWARAIATNHHDDNDEPPDWPQFKPQGAGAPKRSGAKIHFLMPCPMLQKYLLKQLHPTDKALLPQLLTSVRLQAV
jgi:hypothetical protein